jgi:hypothetical protein
LLCRNYLKRGALPVPEMAEDFEGLAAFIGCNQRNYLNFRSFFPPTISSSALSPCLSDIYFPLHFLGRHGLKNQLY